MKPFRKILFLLLLIIGISVSYFLTREEGNFGDFYGYLVFYSLIIYILAFLILIIINIIRIKKEKFDFRPYLITFIFTGFVWLMHSEFIRGKIIMEAEITNYLVEDYSCYNQIKNIKYPKDHIFIVNITFKDNDKCIVGLNMANFEGINKKFKYKINNDTLSFIGDIIKYSDSLVTNKYFIDKLTKECFPIGYGKFKRFKLKRPYKEESNINEINNLHNIN